MYRDDQPWRGRRLEGRSRGGVREKVIDWDYGGGCLGGKEGCGRRPCRVRQVDVYVVGGRGRSIWVMEAAAWVVRKGELGIHAARLRFSLAPGLASPLAAGRPRAARPLGAVRRAPRPTAADSIPAAPKRKKGPNGPFSFWWRRRQSHCPINQYVALLNARNAPIDTPRLLCLVLAGLRALSSLYRTTRSGKPLSRNVFH